MTGTLRAIGGGARRAGIAGRPGEVLENPAKPDKRKDRNSRAVTAQRAPGVARSAVYKGRLKGSIESVFGWPYLFHRGFRVGSAAIAGQARVQIMSTPRFAAGPVRRRCRSEFADLPRLPTLRRRGKRRDFAFLQESRRGEHASALMRAKTDRQATSRLRGAQGGYARPPNGPPSIASRAFEKKVRKLTGRQRPLRPRGRQNMAASEARSGHAQHSVGPALITGLARHSRMQNINVPTLLQTTRR